MSIRTAKQSQISPGPAFSNRHVWLVACGLGLVGLLLSASISADSFRCGRQVVRSGDSQSQLLSTCGEPQRRDSAQEALWIGSSQKTVKVHRWYYKNSGRSLERVVLLYQGEVVAVRSGKR